MRAEHRPAEENQQKLYRGNKQHDKNKALVFPQICQKIDPMRSGVEGVENTAENKKREESGHKAGKIAGKIKCRAEYGKPQECRTHKNRIAARNQNLLDHVARHDRFPAALRLFLHICRLRRLSCKRKPRERIHDDIDPKHLHDRHRRIHTDKRTEKRHTDRTEIHRQLKHDKFPYAVKNRAPVKNRFCDRGEIVVKNHDIASVFGDFRAASHGKADIRPFERRSIVDAVARHADHKSQLLGQTDKPAFIGRKRARHDPQGRNGIL